MNQTWSHSLTEHLIQLYRDEPGLWNSDSPDYINHAKIAEAWKKLASKCNTSIDQVQLRIYNLRNQFQFELRKRNEDPLYISQWRYYLPLSFLKDSCSNRKAKTYKTEISQDFEEVNLSEAEESTMDVVSVYDEPQRKRSRQTEPEDDPFQRARAAEADDQYDIFAKYVASEMRSLTSDYWRNRMKRRIQEVVIEMQEMDQQQPWMSASAEIQTLMQSIVDGQDRLDTRLMRLEGENATIKSELVTLNKTTRTNNTLQKRLSKVSANEQLVEETTDNMNFEISTRLPLSSIEEVDEFEHKLQNTEFANTVHLFLLKMKGMSLCVDDIFRQIMKDNCVKEFNWDGRLGKRSMFKLYLFNTILADVFQDLSKAEFEKQMRRAIELSHNRYKQILCSLRKKENNSESLLVGLRTPK